MKTLSIVMPIFNEEELLSELVRRMTSVLDGIEKRFDLETEWILVNDGSRDRTLPLLTDCSLRDARIVIIDLSRNFGHQPAIQAGLEYTHGDAVVVMDGDLQDPPELIPELIEQWALGTPIVIAKRRSRADAGIKGMMFRMFHAMLKKVSDMPIETDSGVFGLLDRRSVDELLALEERNRFLPGLRSWIGFDQANVLYDRELRAAGAPKQTFGRLVRYAFDAIFSFSNKPLRAIWSMGFVVSILSVVYALYLITLRVFRINVVPGFTTPTVAILFLGGIQLISVGVLGEYLARIYDEVKKRPHYIVKRVIRNSSAIEPAAIEPSEVYDR